MNHQIERVQLQTTNAPAEIEGQEYQNYLVFPKTKIRLPLARSRMSGNRLEMGFFPYSLKLRWLKQDELLWISWTTVSLGSGGYTHDGNVILQIDNDRCRELFRDYFASHGRAGWTTEYSASLEIDYSDRDKIFYLTRLSYEVNGDMGAPDPRHPLPFTITFTNDDGKIGYLSKVNKVDKWAYKLSAHKLKFLHGSSAVDVGDDAASIEEIVNCFDVSRTKLDSMNPRLRNKQKAADLVTLSESLKPYEISSDDGLDGDK